MKKIIVGFTLVGILTLGNAWGKHGIGGGGMPPGLQGKSMPRGLQMQGKTPAGWSKGHKKGWYKVHTKKHKVRRRAVIVD